MRRLTMNIAQARERNMTGHMHLNLFIHGSGHHEAAWRHPDASPLTLTDIRYYIDLARKAEAGLFRLGFPGGLAGRWART